MLQVLLKFFLTYFQGFDEYMNLVLDNAEEISLKKRTRKPLGMLMYCAHSSPYVSW